VVRARVSSTQVSINSVTSISVPLPQEAADSRPQLLRTERLHHVIVRTEIERSRDVLLPPAGRQHDDAGFIGKRSHPMQDVEAGHLRHHQIEDQNIRLFPFDCLEGLLTVESNRRAESFHAHMCVDDAGPAMKRLRAFRSATSGSSSSMHGGEFYHPGRDNLLERGVVLFALTLQISAVFFTDFPGPVPAADCWSRNTRSPAARLS
jgi:hypothetical protein